MIRVGDHHIESKIPYSAISLEANKQIIQSLLHITRQYGDTLTWDKHPREYEGIESAYLAQDDAYQVRTIHASEVGQRLGGRILGHVLPLPPPTQDNPIRLSLIDIEDLDLRSKKHTLTGQIDPYDTQLVATFGTVDNWSPDEWDSRVASGTTLGWPCYMGIDLHANGMAVLNAMIHPRTGKLWDLFKWGENKPPVVHPHYDYWEELMLDQVVPLRDYQNHSVQHEQLSSVQLNAIAAYVINRM